ncbi:unnamed protein product [Absidia cylindrospora]
MSTMTNTDVLTNEWVKKLHFENRVDLNLQIPASGESIKVEVGDIPPEHIPQLGLLSLGNDDDFTSLLTEKKQSKTKSESSPSSAPTTDSYLSSIVSSTKTNITTTIPTNDNTATTTTSATTTATTGSCQNTSDCTCYKCQRQRRRAGTRGRMIPTETPSATSTTPPTRSQSRSPQQSRVQTPPSPVIESSTTSATQPAANSTEQPHTPKPSVSRNGSFVLRKKPSSHSYERHLPRPTYSQLDSIYRSQQEQQLDKDSGNDHSVQQDLNKYNKDSYEISWQDETGDDILSSLRTFQTIFEEKPHGSEGLSDLLEVRAQELKMQKIYEKEQQELMDQQQVEPNRPPKRSDCLTLSYRDGPQHKHLTLYHTMKMTGPNERMNAYGRAFQHCVRADSGLASWIEKQSSQPPPSANVSNYQSSLTLKKSTKRSILHLPGRKQKTTAEDLWLRTNKLTDSSSTQQGTTLKDNGVTPIDVLSTANALMPTPSSVTLNPSIGKSNSNKKPYDYVDTPSRPLPRSRNSVDKDSLTSFDMEQGRSTKSGKIWSSLGRKASRSRSNAASIHSVEKVYKQPPSIKETPEPFEKALDDLCQIMTHVDRSVLRTYLEQANGDYMKTLSVIRAEVTSGKL